jgi:hypothetical protein
VPAVLIRVAYSCGPEGLQSGPAEASRARRARLALWPYCSAYSESQSGTLLSPDA